MDDPVTTSDGSIYEKEYITQWFQQRRQAQLPITSPSTGLELSSRFLMPVHALKEASCLSHHVPTDTRWIVEMLCSRKTRDSIGLVFTDVETCAHEPMCFPPGKQFLDGEGCHVH